MSGTLDWAALRARHPVLARLPTVLRQAARRTHLDLADTVFRVGDPASTVLFLLSGEVRLLRRSREGTDIILQRTRGGFFAEASLEWGNYHCDAVVAQAGEMLHFPAPAFRDALGYDPTFRDAWIAHLAREVRRLRSQCERLSLKSAEARILHCLETEGDAGKSLLVPSRKAWAAELGLSHEALYRTLARLVKAGTIGVDGKSICLRR